MKPTWQRRLIIASGFFVACAVGLCDVHADEEGQMVLTRLQLDSIGLDNSGPVHVEATQAEHGVTQLSVSVFGRLYTLKPPQLTAFHNHIINSVGLTYSRGYPNTGGRNVFLLLCQGFSSGIKVFAVVTVAENGGARVDLENGSAQ
jgi:hypothetical protein